LALEAQIRDADLVPACAERRRDVFKPQRLGPEKWGEPEMSCGGARFDEQDPQIEINPFFQRYLRKLASVTLSDKTQVCPPKLRTTRFYMRQEFLILGVLRGLVNPILNALLKKRGFGAAES